MQKKLNEICITFLLILYLLVEVYYKSISTIAEMFLHIQELKWIKNKFSSNDIQFLQIAVGTITKFVIVKPTKSIKLSNSIFPRR